MRQKILLPSLKKKTEIDKFSKKKKWRTRARDVVIGKNRLVKLSWQWVPVYTPAFIRMYRRCVSTRWQKPARSGRCRITELFNDRPVYQSRARPAIVVISYSHTSPVGTFIRQFVAFSRSVFVISRRRNAVERRQSVATRPSRYDKNNSVRQRAVDDIVYPALPHSHPDFLDAMDLPLSPSARYVIHTNHLSE